MGVEVEVVDIRHVVVVAEAVADERKAQSKHRGKFCICIYECKISYPTDDQKFTEPA